MRSLLWPAPKGARIGHGFSSRNLTTRWPVFRSYKNTYSVLWNCFDPDDAHSLSWEIPASGDATDDCALAMSLFDRCLDGLAPASGWEAGGIPTTRLGLKDDAPEPNADTAHELTW
jgi:hypothetical protein